MSNDDLGLLALPLVGVVAVLGVYLICAVYNALPWSTVSPQAQNIGVQATNTGVAAINIDPTLILMVAAVIISSVLGFLGLVRLLSEMLLVRETCRK